MRQLLLALLFAFPLFAAERGYDLHDVKLARGERLLWLTVDGNRGRELWRTDGTPSGTFRIDLEGRSVASYSAPAVLGGRAYVFAEEGFQTFLYESDGTQSGTREVMYIGTTQTWELVSNGKMLFFFSRNWIPDGVRLWRSDGTAAGTKIVTYILSDEVRSLVPFGSGVLFQVRDVYTPSRTRRYETWSSDGTTVTKRLQGIAPYNLVAWKGLVFSAYNRHRSDGTVAGTFMLPVDGPLDEIVAGNDAVFLRSGSDIWRSDGTVEGTFRIYRFPGTPTKMVLAGRQLFVIEDRGPARVTLLGNAGVEIPGELEEATAVGSEVWLRMRTQFRSELWRTDGFTATRIAEDIGSAQYFFSMTELNGRVIFAGDDGVHGHEPWSSDGTVTQQLANVQPEMIFSGRVVDADTSLPLAGALVTAWMVEHLGRTLVAEATTTADGRFTMEGMRDGSYVLQALPRDGHVAQTWPGLDCPDRCGVTLAPPTWFYFKTPRTPFEFRLRRGGRIEGRVVDREGRGVAGVPVMVARQYDVLIVGGAKTDADGRYSAGVPEGEWTVYTSDRTGWSGVVYPGVSCAAGCPIAMAGAAVRPGATNVDFAVMRSGTIRGRLLDAAGQPITKRIRVHATRTNGQPSYFVTTATGQYELVLPDGTWNLEAWSVDPGGPVRVALPQPVSATPGQVTDGFDFHFTRR